MMQFGLKVIVVVLIAASCISAQTPKPTIDDLSWLAGCWESKLNARQINEQWMKPAGGIMLGVGRTVVDGKLREYEFVQIRQETSGDIFYVARPSGQAEASFKLVKLQHHEAVFENLDHDFPQRIIYRLQSDGRLFARVEGTAKGKTRGIDYLYNRAKCD